MTAEQPAEVRISLKDRNKCADDWLGLDPCSAAAARAGRGVAGAAPASRDLKKQDLPRVMVHVCSGFLRAGAANALRSHFSRQSMGVTRHGTCVHVFGMYEQVNEFVGPVCGIPTGILPRPRIIEKKVHSDSSPFPLARRELHVPNKAPSW